MSLLYTEHSLDFDNSNDRVIIGTDSILHFERTDEFSISIWFKTSLSAIQTLIGNVESSPFQGWEVTLFADGSFRFQIINTYPSNAIITDTTSNGFNDGNWHHLCATYNGESDASGMFIYIDSELQPSSVFSNTLSSSILSSASSGWGARSNEDEPWEGNIGDVGAYNKELSLEEVATIYNKGNTTDLESIGPYNNLIAFWPISSNLTYPTVPDLISGNDGTMTNMDAEDIVIEAPRALDLNYSMTFNPASSQYIDVGIDVTEMNFSWTDSFSVCMWAKGDQCSIVNINSSYQGWALIDTSFRLARGANQNRVACPDAEAIRAQGDWTFICATYNGNQDASGIKIYANGVEYTTSIEDNDLNADINTSGKRCWIMGDYYNTEYYRGSVNDVSIWSKELSLDEVNSLYNNGDARDARTIGITTDLVGYWPIQETSSLTVLDLSTAGNDGATVNVSDSDIKLDGPNSYFSYNNIDVQSTIFDGTDWVDMGDVLDFETNESFSLCIFAKVNPGDQRVLITKAEGSGDFEGYVTWITTSGNFLFRLEGNSAVDNKIEVESNIGSLADSEWHLFIVSYNGSGDASGVTMFVDGVSVPYTISDNTLSNSSLNSAPFQIGTRNSGLTPLDGYVSWAAVYSKQLSEIEARILFNERRSSNLLETMPLANLEGYWPFNDNSSYLTVTDLSSNGNNGTLTGYSMSYDVPRSINSSESLIFNGSDESIVIGNVLSFERTDTFSIMCWAKSDTDSSGALTFVGKQEGSGNTRGYRFGIDDSTSGIIFHLGNTASNRIIVTTDNDYRDGYWHNFCTVYNGSSSAGDVRIYVDGFEVSTSIVDDSLSATTITTDELAIGARNSTSPVFYMDGQLDNVAIYNKKLTPSEVFILGGFKEPKDHGAIGPIESLVGWWRLGESINDDAVLADNDGSYVNMDSSNEFNDVKILNTYYKMRGTYLDDGYDINKTTWIASNPDFDGYEAPVIIEIDSAVLISEWSEEVSVYKMRGLSNGSPVVWLSGANPDWDGTIPSESITPGTVVVLGVLPFNIKIPRVSQ